jgi:exosortase C (VPDSG-CTERM-specific)
MRMASAMPATRWASISVTPTDAVFPMRQFWKYLMRPLERSGSTKLGKVVESGPGKLNRQLRLLAIATGLLALCFSVPIIHLVRFTLGSELYSYILLIPFIAVYLAWLKRDQLFVSAPAPRVAVGFGGAAILLLGLFWSAVTAQWTWTESDQLCVLALSFLLFFLGGCAVLMGTKFLRSAAFPLAFLFFITPFPSFVEGAIESFLQHRSADTAYFFLKLSGTPVFREGTLFLLPGLSLEVAPQCSGIRSSLVLFLTGVLAAHFFLRQFRNQVILVWSLVVLGIVRNAVRIFILAQLSIHGNPGIIDSPLHHRGGPLFFAASLIPCLFLIWFLRWYERKEASRKSSTIPCT